MNLTIIKWIGYAVAVAAIMWALVALKNHYDNGKIAIGYTNGSQAVQKEWNAQKEVDAKAKEKAVADALAKQKLGFNEQNDKSIAAYKEVKDANQKLHTALNRANTNKLRDIEGDCTIYGTDTGVPDTGTDSGGTAGTCRAKLPDEIGTAFEQLRTEDLYEANRAELAGIKLNQCIALLATHQKVCGRNQ